MRPSLLILIALSVVLAGCASSRPDPQYRAYVQLVQEQETARQARFASIAAAADRCDGDSCVQMVAAIAALAQAGAGQGAAPQQYRRDPSAAERVGLAMLGQMAPLASAAVAWRSSDNSREIALGQYSFLGGVIDSVVSSPALQGPSITVGGDYITGSQHVGDAVGRDQIGGDQHIGDSIGRDVIGGDRIDNRGNIGRDNRLASPGPFDDSGDRCEGPLCQGVQHPPPPDPEPPEPDPDPAG
jgi:hypothetical protein